MLFRDQLAGIAALGEPVRRALYLFVGLEPREVSRDQAARALRISRGLAAFHLDKLVEAGLLEASFRRLTPRRGPGAGRPSKLYRRAARAIEISLPERHYDLAGALMARAIGSGGAAPEALRREAREQGKRLGRSARGRGAAVDGGRLMTRAVAALRAAGYEPRRDEGGNVVLCNCPFDALARANRDVICGMNHALLEGLVAGLELPGVRATLDPQPGRCCCAIRPDADR
jgi:predicted ArsR family transcriptional regulator